MRKPIAVLTSDVHYNLATLEVADKAMRIIIAKALELDVPLLIAGDLHDTKANLRAECISAMIATFSLMEPENVYILVGNHDLTNEKAETNSLLFLEGRVILLTTSLPTSFGTRLSSSIYCIPYQHDSLSFKEKLRDIPVGVTIIAHQGLSTTNSGDYIHDKSAVSKEDVAGRRIISGHYHTRQTVTLPEKGQWDYIGNPYTLTYGEAKDPAKGYQILYSDGSLEFIPLNLRKHVVIGAQMLEGAIISTPHPSISAEDLVLIKLTGSKEDLSKLDKTRIKALLKLPGEFRLDLQSIDTKATFLQENVTLPKSEILDMLISSLEGVSQEQVDRIKQLWRKL